MELNYFELRVTGHSLTLSPIGCKNLSRRHFKTFIPIEIHHGWKRGDSQTPVRKLRGVTTDATELEEREDSEGTMAVRRRRHKVGDPHIADAATP